MHLGGIGWLLRHLQFVLYPPMLLPPFSFYYLLPVQKGSKLVRFSFVLLLPSAAKSQVLASREPDETKHTFVLSLNLFSSVFCKENFSFSLARCLRNSGSGHFGTVRGRLCFRSGSDGILRSLFLFRKAMDLLNSFFQNIVVFHIHVAQAVFPNRFSMHRGLLFHLRKSRIVRVYKRLWSLRLHTIQQIFPHVPLSLHYLQLVWTVVGTFLAQLPL